MSAFARSLKRFVTGISDRVWMVLIISVAVVAATFLITSVERNKADQRQEILKTHEENGTFTVQTFTLPDGKSCVM